MALSKYRGGTFATQKFKPFFNVFIDDDVL